MTQNMKLTRVFADEREISVVISGHASLDEMLDVFRGFLVQIGYEPSTAAKLQFIEDEYDENRG